MSGRSFYRHLNQMVGFKSEPDGDEWQFIDLLAEIIQELPTD
jgi:hypothetical protein